MHFYDEDDRIMSKRFESFEEEAKMRRAYMCDIPRGERERTCLYSVIVFLLLLSAMLVSCSGGEAQEDDKPTEPKGEDGEVTILLDAGHGFDDIGCKYDYLGGLSELNLTLTYVEKIKTELTSLGYRVILTHDGETFPNFETLTALADERGVEYDSSKMTDNNVFDAYERTIMANCLAKETEIDLMLSIHVNANASSDECEGFEVDYCAENESSKRTKHIFGAICDALEDEFEGRKMKRFADSWDESFIVTKYVSMPSVLIETGFASTPSEAELLISEAWQDRLASAIAAGVKSYFEGE